MIVSGDRHNQEISTGRMMDGETTLSDRQAPVVRSQVQPSGLVDLLNRMNADDRESLIGILRDTNTYVAEDINDVLAILSSLDD